MGMGMGMDTDLVGEGGGARGETINKGYRNRYIPLI